MPRRSLVLAFCLLCSGAALARTTSEAEKKRPRRVLFRTDLPAEPLRPAATPAPKPQPTPAATRRAGSSRTILTRATPPPPRPLLTPAPKAPVPRLEPRLAPRPAERPAPRFDLELQATTFTPYDRYLGTVRAVIAQLDPRPASMPSACELMREGRRFRYVATDPYRAQPPAVTESRRAGDCKSKALWLYDHLGDPGAFYVIGKLQRGSRSSHAWVYWRYGGRWWILDPTDRSTPIAADSVSRSRYVPYYSYSRAGAFRHAATRIMMAKQGIRAVPAIAVQDARR